jgi:thiol:disulfide interchange protein DsbD
VYDPVKWGSACEQIAATEAELTLTATIDAGWAMYSMHIPDGPARPVPTSFSLESSKMFEPVGEMEEITRPAVKYDENFGMDVGQFRDKAIFRQRIRILSQNPFTVKGTVEYMCCNDRSCLPPAEWAFAVSITPQEAATPMLTPAPVQLDAAPETDVLRDETPVAIAVSGEQEQAASLWGFFFTALSMGFLGVLTPCVYPMIPIIISFFLREGKGRGWIKAVIFGLSVICIYTFVGVAVALTKRADLANAIVGHWMAHLVFALLFLAFSLSFFGLFDITLPSSLSGKADQKANKSGWFSAFFIALTLVIVSFSCTGPFVGSILVASAQGLSLKPVLGMFGFGLAFSLPFVLLSFFPELLKKLPKSGGWMNSVKVTFAFVMLAFAVYFLQEAGLGISRTVFLCIWIVIAVMLGLYLLGKIRFVHDGEQRHTGVIRMLLAMASFTFALYLFTGLSGEPLRIISAWLPAEETAATQKNTTNAPAAPAYDRLCGVPKYSEYPNLKWTAGLQGYFHYDDAIACAQAKNKPILMIFKGEHCAKCREMEANIWTDAEVLRLMNERFVLLALYTDVKIPLPENEYFISTFDGKLKKTLGQKNADMEIIRYQTNEFPYHAILDSNGKTIGQPLGYTNEVEIFRDFLNSVNGETLIVR